MVVQGDKVVLLGFIPHDERTFAFNMAFTLFFSVIDLKGLFNWPFAKAARASFGDAVREGKKKEIPGDIAYYATACSRFGYCVSTCEQFARRGWESQSPRGKYHYI